VLKRDARRDTFARVIEKAMQTKLGSDAEEVQKVLIGQGITRSLAKEAISIAQAQGGFTIFSMVDALTRIAGKIVNAGDRVESTRRPEDFWQWQRNSSTRKSYARNAKGLFIS